MASQEERERFEAREARVAKQRQRKEERKALEGDASSTKERLQRERSKGDGASSSAGIDASSLQQEQQPSTVELLKKTVRTTHETIDVGDETAMKLRMQSEQLDRVDKKFDDVEYNLKVSDRLVKGMGGITGKIGSWFTRKPKAPPTVEEKAAKKAQQSKSWLSGWMGGSSNNKPAPGATTAGGGSGGNDDASLTAAKPYTSRNGSTLSNGSTGSTAPSTAHPGQLTQEEEDLLDAISRNVGTIKRQAQADSYELKDQDQKLSELAEKAEFVDGHVKKTNKKIAKLLK